MKKLLEELKEAVKQAEMDNDKMDSADWGYQEGYLLTFNELKLIIHTIEKLNKVDI